MANGLLNGGPKPEGLLGINQGAVDWLRGGVSGTPNYVEFLGGDPFAPSGTEGSTGLTPWAGAEQIHKSGFPAGLPKSQGSPLGSFGRPEVLSALFPHLGEAGVQQAITGQASGAGGSGSGGGAATGSLEQRFPNSAGKYPLKPFEPIPAGLPYQQARDIISTGGLPQGQKDSKPSQALEALEWLRSKIPTVQR